MAEVTLADYLRSRGWFRFKGDEQRWYHRDHHPGTSDGLSEDEAEKMQSDLDRTTEQYLRDNKTE